MGRRGREKARELYDTDHHYEQIMEIYRELSKS
jgi:hypothetical protein